MVKKIIRDREKHSHMAYVIVEDNSQSSLKIFEEVLRKIEVLSNYTRVTGYNIDVRGYLVAKIIKK